MWLICSLCGVKEEFKSWEAGYTHLLADTCKHCMHEGATIENQVIMPLLDSSLNKTQKLNSKLKPRKVKGK